MNGDKQFSTLVETIYEAGVDGGRWVDLADAMARVFGGVSCVLAFEGQGGRALAVSTGAVDAAAARRYNDHYGRLDPFMPAMMGAGQGAVRCSDALFTPAQIRRSEFYNDYLRPLGIHSALGASIEHRDGRLALLALHRAPRARPFGGWEFNLAAALLPHLRRAIGIHRRLDEALSRAETAATALDAVAIGMLALDGCGRVLFASSRAEAITARRDGLSLSATGQLRAADRHEAAELDRLVAAAALDPGGPGDERGGYLRVKRPDGRGAYVVLAAPLPRNVAGPLAAVAGGRARVLVLIRDPDAAPRPSPELLVRMYGLTPAEARLAAAIAAGMRVKDYAERERVSMNTLRFHLKHIFAKTDTRGQSALVTELLRGLAALHLPPT